MVPKELVDNHVAMTLIRRFTKTERAAHWLVAAAFGVMLLSGGMVPHHWGWTNTALDVHVGAALVLVGGLVGLLGASHHRR
jgi:cytochrome b subunit of formate dehydrogenase